MYENPKNPRVKNHENIAEKYYYIIDYKKEELLMNKRQILLCSVSVCVYAGIAYAAQKIMEHAKHKKFINNLRNEVKFYNQMNEES